MVAPDERTGLYVDMCGKCHSKYLRRMLIQTFNAKILEVDNKKEKNEISTLQHASTHGSKRLYEGDAGCKATGYPASPR